MAENKNGGEPVNEALTAERLVDKYFFKLKGLLFSKRAEAEFSETEPEIVLTDEKIITEGGQAICRLIREMEEGEKHIEVHKTINERLTLPGSEHLEVDGNPLHLRIVDFIQHPCPKGKLPTGGTFHPQLLLVSTDPYDEASLTEGIEAQIGGILVEIEETKRNTSIEKSKPKRDKLEEQLERLYDTPISEMTILHNGLRWNVFSNCVETRKTIGFKITKFPRHFILEAVVFPSGRVGQPFSLKLEDLSLSQGQAIYDKLAGLTDQAGEIKKRSLSSTRRF